MGKAKYNVPSQPEKIDVVGANDPLLAIISFVLRGCLGESREENVKPKLSEYNLPSQPNHYINSIEEYHFNNLATALENVVGVEELDSWGEEAAATLSKTRRKKKRQNKEEPVRKIGPYVSTHKILFVGEGDFSFSASLAVAFGYASNIVATSLNEQDFLMKNFRMAMANIEEFENRGAFVIHGVDATKMAKHELLSRIKFDRIIFNFPHSGAFGSTESDLSQNQKLVRRFLRNAKRMIVEDGEIHVTHKTTPFFMKWNIVQLASIEGLGLVEEAPFHHAAYPGYRTKYGFGGDRNFHCYPCSIYKFKVGSRTGRNDYRHGDRDEHPSGAPRPYGGLGGRGGRGRGSYNNRDGGNSDRHDSGYNSRWGSADNRDKDGYGSKGGSHKAGDNSWGSFPGAEVQNSPGREAFPGGWDSSGGGSGWDDGWDGGWDVGWE